MADEYGPWMDASAGYAVATAGGGLLVPRRCIIGYRPGKVHTGGWFSEGEGLIVHANSAHLAIGVIRVRLQDDGDVEIITDGRMTPVTSISCDPDETLAARGIDVGPSVGSSTILRYSMAGVGRLYLNRQEHWDLIAGPQSNSWHMWETAQERAA